MLARSTSLRFKDMKNLKTSVSLQETSKGNATGASSAQKRKKITLIFNICHILYSVKSSRTTNDLKTKNLQFVHFCITEENTRSPGQPENTAL